MVDTGVALCSTFMVGIGYSKVVCVKSNHSTRNNMRNTNKEGKHFCPENCLDFPKERGLPLEEQVITIIITCKSNPTPPEVRVTGVFPSTPITKILATWPNGDGRFSVVGM